ncbi:thioredoxin domain-containing protein [Conexibacter sp. JD483]|uniref:DsbA family protein n=1 Tax=unclassified Conexibacter TaxID=2627773 RepID=UPI00271E2B37|nr:MULTISPECIES: thioredoxin domain-containing protein [unclassified Conexibacter]MDO8185646.1 thioredoxin domain-containing protein [Conexibacter sp. CPCC 205706]MDO8198819.1 thioredoxin domain-containing protein [Conexibacter sp. CPCC 205762]MDR9367831.1 thioredoxin domain-containing protein [Conexibacter sp. JD483]
MKGIEGKAVAFALAAALAVGGLAGCGGNDDQTAGGAGGVRTSTTAKPGSLAAAAAAEGVPVRPVSGAEATERRLRGIPQQGLELGAHDAPVTVVLFADVQCPYCKAFWLRVLPHVVDHYVRDGRAKVVLRDVAFLGTDSIRGAQFAGAAGLQDKLWDVVDLLYRHQGAENSGWVTDELLRRIGAGVPGLATERALADRGDRRVNRQLKQARAIAADYRVTGTPTLLVGETDGFVFPVPGGETLAGLSAAIDGALSNLSGG